MLGPGFGVEFCYPRDIRTDFTLPHAADERVIPQLALHTAMAEYATAWDLEPVRGGSPVTPEEMETRAQFYLERIPSRLTRMRYHSFLVYFSLLKCFGWAEATGRTEASEAQEKMGLQGGEGSREAGQPRVFYRLTAEGRRAPGHLLSDPIQALYNYTRAQRSAKKKYVYYTPPQRRR